MKAYVTYVRPLLEYAVCIWSPYQLDDIAKIECVERRFTKRLPGLSNTSYSDRLAVPGLRSLQLRRLHQDLIYTYKILYGLVDLDCLKFFLISPNETTRGHVSKLFVCHSRVDVRRHSFGNRIVKIYNSLPATMEAFASSQKFESFIERVD